MMASRYSVYQSCFGGRLDARIDLLHGGVAAHFAARIQQILDQRREQWVARRPRSTSKVSAAPQTPVRRSLAFSDDGARHGEIGIAIDIHVTMPSRWPMTGTRASCCTRATRLLPPRGTITSM